jgi:ketosteroid isomerase-like protein
MQEQYPSMSTQFDLLSIVQRYLTAIEQGVTGEALAEFSTPDVLQEEYPNRLVQNGAQRDKSALLEAALRGQQVMTAQRYEILNAIVSGNQVALEVQWTGTLAIPFGSIPAGGQMRARCAMFLEFRDRKIARQRNYDCFEPW